MPLTPSRAPLGILVLAAAALAAGCAPGKAAPSAPDKPPPPRPVEVLEMRPVEVHDAVEYLGVLSSRASVDVRPQAGGYVRAVHVVPGQRVAAGDLIVEIDSRVEAAAVDSARARVASAKAALAQARRNYERVAALKKEGLAPAEELDRARAEVDVSRASLRAAEAQVSLQEVQLQFHQVHAPAAGVVGDVLVRVGDSVAAGQPLTTLAEGRELELTVSVPSDRARAVVVGQTPIQVLDGAGRLLVETPVFYVAPNANPRTQLVELKARVANEAGLREQELVRARVMYGKHEALEIPALAVSRQSGQAFAFVVGERDGGLAVEKRVIRLGALRERGFEVVEGLAAGERIAVSSIHLLRDGVPVSVQTAAPLASDEAAPEGRTP